MRFALRGSSLLAAVALAVAAPATGDAPRSVWIDCDLAVGVPDRDVDDGLALLQAFRSPELDLRGVSSVFGNATLDDADRITRDMVERFGPEGLRVHRGAASATDLGARTEASAALAVALEREPLVLLALGPATNVATLLRTRPDLGSRIQRIIAVAGRRPGQRFTTGTTNARGHRDFNFELDPQAFREILATEVPLTLAPWELSSKVWFGDAELDRFAAGDEATRWLVAPARAWLGLWRERFAVAGFNPFDTLAVAALTHPERIACEAGRVRIVEAPNDVTDPAMQGTEAVESKPYLHFEPRPLQTGRSPAQPADGRAVRYCHTPAPEVRELILGRILGS